MGIDTRLFTYRVVIEIKDNLDFLKYNKVEIFIKYSYILDHQFNHFKSLCFQKLKKYYPFVKEFLILSIFKFD